MSIDYDDFGKLDLRVAKILTVEKIPGKSRIVKGEIDLGEEKRNVIIGGAEFYETDDLVGKIVIVVTNLVPKKIAGIESNPVSIEIMKKVSLFLSNHDISLIPLVSEKGYFRERFFWKIRQDYLHKSCLLYTSPSPRDRG